MKNWLSIWLQLMTDAGRVLRDHWPQMLGLGLIGVIGRMGFLWLADWASRASATLGILILPLAPLSTLMTLVLMLRMAGETLPAFYQIHPGATTWERWSRHLIIAAQVLIPFIAAYACQGLLEQDAKSYAYTIGLEAVVTDPLNPHFERYEYASGWYLAGMVIGAFFIRKLISLTDAFRRSALVAILGVYLESLWVVTLTNVFMSSLKNILQWFRDRAFVDGILKYLESLSAWLGPLGDAIRISLGWLGEISAGVGIFVVMPLAWLAIGAASYQADLVAGEAIPGTEKYIMRRLEKFSTRSRRVLLEIAEPVITPLRVLGGALSRVLITGPAPIIMFCASFVAVDQIGVFCTWILGRLAGPRPALLNLAVESYAESAGRVVYYVLTAALLAAALNFIVGGGRNFARNHGTTEG